MDPEVEAYARAQVEQLCSETQLHPSTIRTLILGGYPRAPFAPVAPPVSIAEVDARVQAARRAWQETLEYMETRDLLPNGPRGAA